jgi:hypothetical protein
LVAACNFLQAAPPNGQDKENKLRLESSAGITTEVERTTTGELKPADLQQASVLAAHLLRDIRETQLAIDGDKLDDAATRLKKAGDLVGIIQKLLPTTKISVVVKDKDGKVLYQDEHQIKMDSIPIMQNVIVVDLLRPLVADKAKAAKEDDTGFQLTDSELVAMQVSVDVDFLARRIHDAEKALKSDQGKAADMLAAAIEDGVDVATAEFAQPLVEVRDALWFAHRAVANHKYAEAKANLATAREQLATYNHLLSPAEQKEASTLANDIQQIENELKNPTPEKHSKLLGGIEQSATRAMRWFGAKRQATPPAAEATAAKPEATKQK